MLYYGRGISPYEKESKLIADSWRCSKVALWLAVASLVVAIAAIIAAILW